jgi:hypothetical protein
MSQMGCLGGFALFLFHGFIFPYAGRGLDIAVLPFDSRIAWRGRSELVKRNSRAIGFSARNTDLLLKPANLRLEWALMGAPP